MNILWKLGEGSVHDVLAQLPKGRNLAYTSVSTILRILEQKAVVGNRKEGRGHVYFPRVPKQEYETVTLDHVVAKVFEGEPTSLVRRLLDSKDMSESELKDLRKLLDERLKS
jgi:predicted transcriptional regulator